MAYRSVTVRRFGGLRGTSDPADIGLEASTAALNVEFPPDRSSVSTRAGSRAFNTSGSLAAPSHHVLPFTDSTGVDYLTTAGVSGANVYIDKISNTGVVTAIGNYAWTVSPPTPVNMVAFGSPGTSTVFIASAGTLMRSTTGSSLTTSIGKPRYLGVTASSNRLVQAGFAAAADSPTGANGDPSAVFFSDAGLPTTFSANNYVLLRPGDGEKIHGVASYQDLLFVFKESSVFIFYGESTDATGQPEFNYREQRLPSGILKSSTTGAYTRVAVGADGVYFLANDGVYLTNGGAPVKISRDLDATYDEQSKTNLVIGVADDRVFVFYTIYDCWVLDRRNGQWVTWILPSQSAGIKAPPVAWPEAFGDGRAVFHASDTTVYRTDAAYTTDDSSVILASYLSGRSDLGSSDEKQVRQIELWGSAPVDGVIALSPGVDYDAFTAPSDVTVGTSTAASGKYRVAQRGTYFAFAVASTNTRPFEVNAVGFDVRDTRAPGMSA